MIDRQSYLGRGHLVVRLELINDKFQLSHELLHREISTKYGMQSKLVDPRKRTGRAASDKHQVALKNKQRRCPGGRDTRKCALGQGIDSHHQIVWTQKKVEDDHPAGPRARGNHLLYSDNCPPRPYMTQTDLDLPQRMAACESELEAHRGYLKALEYGLRAAIISHPRPEAMAHVWREMLPAMADAHRGRDGAVFTAALEQALTLLTEQIEAPPVVTH